MRRNRIPPFLTAAVVLGACVSSGEEGARSKVGPPEARPTVQAIPEPGGTEASTPSGSHADAASVARGKELFEAVCAPCHSMQPPPKQAPPMAMVVRHYRQALESDAAVRDRMIRWIAEPTPDRSALPAHAIERFGIMAPQPLPEEDRAAVVDYLLSTVAADAAAMGRGHRKGAGMRGHGTGEGRGTASGCAMGPEGHGMGGAAEAGCAGGCTVGHAAAPASAGAASGGG